MVNVAGNTEYASNVTFLKFMACLGMEFNLKTS